MVSRIPILQTYNVVAVSTSAQFFAVSNFFDTEISVLNSFSTPEVSCMLQNRSVKEFDVTFVGTPRSM